MTNEKELSDILETIKTKIHDLPEHRDYMGRIDKKTVLNLFNKKFKSENLTERIMELEKEVCPLREQVVDQREKIFRLKTKLEEQMPALDMMKLEKEISRLKRDYKKEHCSWNVGCYDKVLERERTKTWKLLEGWRGQHCIYEECVMNPCPKCKRFYDHFAKILNPTPLRGTGERDQDG